MKRCEILDEATERQCVLLSGHEGPHLTAGDSGFDEVPAERSVYAVSAQRTRALAAAMVAQISEPEPSPVELVSACFEILAITAGMAFEGTAAEAWDSLTKNPSLRAAFVATFDSTRATEGPPR